MSIDRKKLSTFTDELQTIYSRYKFVFKCALCLRDFSIKDIEEGRVINAHIIPGKLGGSITTIACRCCDSRIGHDIEGPTINYLHDSDVIQGRKSGKMRGKSYVSIGNKLCPTQVSSTSDGKIVVKILNPAHVAKFFEQNFVKPPFQIRMYLQQSRKARDDKVAPLLLKMAYLAAFDQYGYTYILQKELDWIRAILKDPTSNEMPYRCALLSQNPLLAGPVKGMEYLLFPVKVNEFNVPTFIARNCLVVLPPLERNSKQVFNGYGLEGKEQIRIEYRVIHAKDKMVIELKLFIN